MYRKALIVLATLSVVAVTAPPSQGDVRRERPPDRPSIVEVGHPFEIDSGRLRREASRISELQDYLAMYGSPEYAEIQEIVPEWPWDAYEVRLFYLRQDLELAFGHVFISAAAPNLGVVKSRAAIAPEKRRQIDAIIEARATQPEPAPASAPAAVAPAAAAAAPEPPPDVEAAAPPPAPATGGLPEDDLARLQAAASQAEAAAARATEQSEAAEKAADRATRITETMEHESAPNIATAPATHAHKHKRAKAKKAKKKTAPQ